ncbi:MAG: Fic family protein [Pasteurella sp.]|nr:Fic family protein [Pasteurella sp.]
MKKQFSQGVYTIQETAALNHLLATVDSLNETIKQNKAKHSELWQSIVAKLRVDWTYHTNTIEGSTLSRGETHFFLTEGLTVEGKPFKDFVDAKNHAEAIDFLYEIVNDKREITEGLIKEINALLLSGITYTDAVNDLGQRVKKKAHPGEYKKQPNHVIQADGSIHWYVEPIQVPTQMAELVNWVSENKDNYHPIIVAAILHYNLVRIHTFDDGNGRGSRLLMNLVLMKNGYFPAVIRIEKKRTYLNALQLADKGDVLPFVQFIADELIDTMEKVIFDLNNAQS